MDFLINVLQDHEKRMNTLIARTEEVIQDKHSSKLLAQSPPSTKITLRNWDEFRDRALEADQVCFEIVDPFFTCKAITRTEVYVFRERMPEIEPKAGQSRKCDENDTPPLNGKLKIGLELFAKKVNESYGEGNTTQGIHELDALYTKNWLSRELCINRDDIVQGSVG